MCDESSGLQNILQSHQRREPKIILERGEYIFPALKNSLVSVFVSVHIERKTIKLYLRKIIWLYYRRVANDVAGCQA